MIEIDITDKVNKTAKYIIISLVTLIIGMIIAIFIWQLHARYVTLSNGQIAGNLVKVKNMVPGVITEILVSDGENVESGKVLAKMRVKISPEQLQELEKSLETAKARYNELLTRPVQQNAVQPKPNPVVSDGAAEANLAKAKQEKEKMDNLFAIGGISGVKYKEAIANYERELVRYKLMQNMKNESLQSEPAMVDDNEQLLKVADLQVKQAEKALKQAKEEIQIVEIMANIDGKVYFNDVKADDEVEAGQDIFSIGNLREVWLEIPINENQRNKIKLGQFVEYTISDYPGQTFCGTVYEIIDDIGNSENSYATEYRVRISIPADTNVEIKPGMKVVAKISV